MDKKSKVNRALLAIIILLIVVCVVAGMLAFPKIRAALSNKAPTDTTSTTSTASAVITTLEKSRAYQYDNMEIMKLTIEYPEVTLTNNPDAAQRINEQIELQVDAHTKSADELYQEAVEAYDDLQKEGFPFHPWEAYLQFQVTYNAHGLLSLYIDRYVYQGGAHGNTLRSSATWDLAQGVLRTLDCFYEPGFDYQSLILEAILKQAQDNMAQDPYLYFEEYQDSIKECFNQQSFYLAPDGLVIYYQQYEIAPYSTGIAEFAIPNP